MDNDLVHCDPLRCHTHIPSERCLIASDRAVTSNTKHTLNVWTAFIHLKNNPVTKFYEYCDKKQVGIC
jgi:hypothetical protein